MKKILTCLLAVFFFSGAIYISTSATGYKLMIEEVSIQQESIQPGEIFDLSLKLKNNSDRDLKDISILLTNIEGTDTLNGFSPVGTSNEIYIDTIKKGETLDKSIKLISDPNLEVGTYNIVLNSFYKEKNRSTLNQQKSTIGLLLQNKSRLIITDFKIPDFSDDIPEEESSEENFDSEEITIDFVNAGKDSIYNLSFKLTSDSETVEKYYGELSSEEEDSLEFFIPLNSESHGTLEITYTNWLNKEEKIVKEF